jgi:hypothetical protein
MTHKFFNEKGELLFEIGAPDPVQEPIAWLQRRSIDSFAADGYETCEPSDYGAFPVYAALESKP